MKSSEVIYLLSAGIAIFIVLVLQYIYRTRFKKNIKKNGSKVNLVGILVLLASFILALMLM